MIWKKRKQKKLTEQEVEGAVKKESELFEDYFHWLEEHMPPAFFEEIEPLHAMMVAHNLMGFPLQDHFSQFRLHHCAIVMCLDSPDADIKILRHYNMYGIKNYQAFISDVPPPFEGVEQKLRIGVIYFTEYQEVGEHVHDLLSNEDCETLYSKIQEKNPEMERKLFEHLLENMNARFVRSMNEDRLITALEMFLRAKSRDHCQYEINKNEDWKESGAPSVQIVLAWRNAPKHRFLYRLAKMVYRHNLVMKRVNATYIEPWSKKNILIMSIGFDGIDGQSAWEATDLNVFLRELVMLKYFDTQDSIETVFVDNKLLTGNYANLLRGMVDFIHQSLTYADPNLYDRENIEEGLVRHPELTVMLLELFKLKFHPEKNNQDEFKKTSKEFLKLVEDLDTGNEINDTRRKNILRTGHHFVDYTLKNNFYRNNKSSLSFRLDPHYLDELPYDRKERFPELPFAIFFIKGMHFIGFHIRFKDLSRGGLRTVFPRKMEQMEAERNNVFSECYNLAYTQQKKNKDIPEGGSKGVIFLEPYDVLQDEGRIYEKELRFGGVDHEEIDKRIAQYETEQKTQYLYQSQRSYVHGFMTLINCEENGVLKAKHIVDYYKRPEYIYLGPDENMHNEMIEWIAEYAVRAEYKPKKAFISSKPDVGINHKEFGVTSLGVNVYMIETLKHLGIDPTKDPFTIKISGGPDGDVAGNQILNLYRDFPETAKLVALIDVSGTIFDPGGLDLKAMSDLFHEGKSIRHYPAKLLHEGGFLVDAFTKREQTAYTQQTLCYRMKGKTLEEDWLSGNDMNHLLRHNVHQVKADIFIPAGGRPRTLNDNNWTDFLDESGNPTSRAIVEGANLYLTQGARRQLEDKGVMIVKDSSANKGGVICSSYEVLLGLTITDKEFLELKESFMPEILSLIAEKARSEGQLLIRANAETGKYFTDISEEVSERINAYTYQILDYLETIHLPNNPNDPLILCLFHSCPPFLREKFSDRIIKEIPDVHKKAMIAAYIAAKAVYRKGLSWSPSIVDVLPLLTVDPLIMDPKLSGHKVEKLD